VETLSNNKRKEMFIEFMEDYNTATLPHKKYAQYKTKKEY
jgi:hypothetical protein